MKLNCHIKLSLAALGAIWLAGCASPKLPGVGAAVQKHIDSKEFSGAVTVVADRDKILHVETTGLANLETGEPMRPDTLFWVASMTKPVTATALMMLQDEGKLDVHDPVAKYIPEFASLKTPSGQPANLTILQIMTHTSGLGEAPNRAAAQAHTLADLIPLFVGAPMQFEPGSKWQYCQSGINTASRIIEIASGMPYDEFVKQRILDPLGMAHSTFHPGKLPAGTPRAVGYTNDAGKLVASAPPTTYGEEGHPVLGNGGLFSTGPDYMRFAQMLLNGGELDGKRYLSPAAFKMMTTVQTGDLSAGFIPGQGANYGWGVGVCILKEPHPGVAAMLSPGTFGHGGAWGTQAWIDPTRGLAYVLMVQRPNANGDASDIRADFQQAAFDALKK